MKRFWIVSLLLISGVAFATTQTGSPVPGTWFRSGPVTLGAGLYLTHISTALTALAGGAQASTESPTVTEVNQFSTVASGNDSLTLGCDAAGKTRVIGNSAASNAMKIFAITPGTVNGIATATGYSLAAGKAALCVAVVKTSTANACNWICAGP
jgi:hypothetical protein